MKITTSNYEILDTGSIVLPDNEYLEFEIESLKFRITFNEECEGENKDQSRITGQLVQEVSGSYFSMRIINYNSLFSTPIQLLEMGTVGGKKLFLNFSVVPLSSSDNNKTRVFHYTWYKSKELNNGTGTDQE